MGREESDYESFQQFQDFFLSTKNKATTRNKEAEEAELYFVLKAESDRGKIADREVLL